MNFIYDSGWHYMLLNFSSHQKYMDINILHNLDCKKIASTYPNTLIQWWKKKFLIVLAINFFFQDSYNVWYSCINTPIPQPVSLRFKIHIMCGIFKDYLCVYIYDASNLAIIFLIDYLPTHGNQKNITTTSWSRVWVQIHTTF